MTDSEQSDSPPTGEIVLEFSFDSVVRVEDIICHWTKDEVAALLAGDQEAREELIGAAVVKALGNSHDATGPDDAEITIEGRRL